MSKENLRKAIILNIISFILVFVLMFITWKLICLGVQNKATIIEETIEVNKTNIETFKNEEDIKKYKEIYNSNVYEYKSYTNKGINQFILNCMGYEIKDFPLY